MFSCVCIDKLRSSAMREAADTYLERIRRHHPFDERELKASRATRSAPETRLDESQRLLAAMPKHAMLIALDERGEGYTSLAFAEVMRRHMDGGRKICFAIGGAYGHDALLRTRAELVWALSPLTLPHELARVVLYEQIYRTMTILRGEPYHK